MRLGLLGLVTALALLAPPAFGDEIQAQIDLLFDSTKPREARKEAAQKLADVGRRTADPRISSTFLKAAYLLPKQDYEVFTTLCFMKIPSEPKKDKALVGELVAFFGADLTHPNAVLFSALQFGNALFVIDDLLAHLEPQDKAQVKEAIFKFIERNPDSVHSEHAIFSLLNMGDRSKRTADYIDRLLFLDPPPTAEYDEILSRRGAGLSAKLAFVPDAPDGKQVLNPTVYGLPLAKAYFEANQPYELVPPQRGGVRVQRALLDVRARQLNEQIAEALGLTAYVDPENENRLNEAGERKLLGFALKRSFNDEQWEEISKARQRILVEGFASREALGPAVEALAKAGIPRTQRRKLVEVLFPSTTWSTSNRACDGEFEKLREKAAEAEAKRSE